MNSSSNFDNKAYTLVKENGQRVHESEVVYANR